jgi:hypothetical protein
MVHAVVYRNIFNLEWIDTLQATDVETVLFRIRPTSVMGVDATDGAKIVLRRLGIELVKTQDVDAFQDLQA